MPLATGVGNRDSLTIVKVSRQATVTTDLDTRIEPVVVMISRLFLEGDRSILKLADHAGAPPGRLTILGPVFRLRRFLPTVGLAARCSQEESL